MWGFGHTQLILMGFNINEVFMWGFGHTKLYSNGILY